MGQKDLKKRIYYYTILKGLCQRQICDIYGLASSTVSYHIKCLKRDGVIVEAHPERHEYSARLKTVPVYPILNTSGGRFIFYKPGPNSYKYEKLDYDGIEGGGVLEGRIHEDLYTFSILKRIDVDNEPQWSKPWNTHPTVVFKEAKIPYPSVNMTIRLRHCKGPRRESLLVGLSNQYANSDNIIELLQQRTQIVIDVANYLGRRYGFIFKEVILSKKPVIAIPIGEDPDLEKALNDLGKIVLDENAHIDRSKGYPELDVDLKRGKGLLELPDRISDLESRMDKIDLEREEVKEGIKVLRDENKNEHDAIARGIDYAVEILSHLDPRLKKDKDTNGVTDDDVSYIQ